MIEGATYYYCKDTQCVEAYKRELYQQINPKFCEKCVQETTNESIGYLSTINFIGTSYIPNGDVCTNCNPYRVKKAFVFLRIPLFRSNDSYRLIKISKSESLIRGSSESYISRKLK